jgi:ABC-2 type transport system permease protein
MMARIPFHPPLSELLLSMGLLVITFVFMTWVAGKIYRIGILMYGKKASYRELFKWIRYKD